MITNIKCQDKFHEDEYEVDQDGCVIQLLNGYLKVVPLRPCDMANSKYCVGCQEERDDLAEFDRQNAPDLA